MRLALLVLLALLPSASARGQRLFDVKAHGASGRKGDKATVFIQKAIDAAAAAGGGTVLFPPGDYLSGTIRLRSHVTLHLQAGATLWASRDARDYAPMAAADHGQSALVVAEDVEQIALSGKGRIHGQAERVYADATGVDQFIADEIEIARRAGVEMKRWQHVPPVVRGIYIRNARDVTVEDLTIEESPAWLLHLEASERIFIRGVHLASSLEAGVNADGIDIDGCRDVVISDVVVETGDDAIVLKSSRYGGEPRPVENVTVTNCVVRSTSTALKIGTESFGDFRHIRFDNCIVRDSNRGLAIIVRDGATVEDVTFSHITVETNRKHWNWWGNGEALWLVVKKRNPDSKVGTIRGVTFEDIVARGQGSSRIEGFAAANEVRPLSDIRLRGVRLFLEPERTADKRATHALEAHHVEGLTLDDVEVRWAAERAEPGWRSALSLVEVGDLRLRRFIGRQGDPTGKAAAVVLENAREAVVREVEALPGTGTLLNIAGAGSRAVVIDGPSLDPLRRAHTKLIWTAGARPPH